MICGRQIGRPRLFRCQRLPYRLKRARALLLFDRGNTLFHAPEELAPQNEARLTGEQECQP